MTVRWRWRVVPLVLAVVFSAALAGCATKARRTPQEQIMSGLSISVWDVAQPKVAGAPDYARGAARVVAEFEAKHGVRVVLRSVNRLETVDLLSGKIPGEKPALVFSTEWPFASEGLPGVPAAVDPAAYLDPAAEYWTRDGKLLAIPAYIHWVAAVYRGDAAADTGQDGETTFYMAGSPAFLRPVLDSPAAGWDADKITAYLTWVKVKYGPPSKDPLAAWEDGTARAIFPVTPHLYEWLRVPGEPSIKIRPIAGPFEEPRFYYSVPGYIVLAGEEPYRTCAALLGEALAANLGRWAARAIAAMPASVSDIPVFNLESGLSVEERSLLIQSVSSGHLRVPTAQDFIVMQSVEDAIRRDVLDFLSGKTDQAQVRESIRQALERHTKP